MKTFTLTLTDPAVQQLEGEMSAHGFTEMNSYLAALMEAHLASQDELRRLLLDGLQSGDAVPASASFWEDLRVETDGMLKEHETGKAAAA